MGIYVILDKGEGSIEEISKEEGNLQVVEEEWNLYGR